MDLLAIIAGMTKAGVANRLYQGRSIWRFNVASHPMLHDFVILKWADARRIAAGEPWQKVMGLK